MLVWVEFYNLFGLIYGVLGDRDYSFSLDRRKGFYIFIGGRWIWICMFFFVFDFKYFLLKLLVLLRL